MRALRIAIVAAAAVACVSGGAAKAATLVGTQVAGGLYFPGRLQNYFDSANGFVPAGYLNTTGTTVTISATAVEFGYSDGTAVITADFTGNQLMVTDEPQYTATYLPLQLVFTNTAFTNLTAGADSFPNGGVAASLSGDVITLAWAGGDLTEGVSVQAIFNLNLPASPRLSIQPTPTNAVVITWPAPSTGFTLQQNNNLNPANWVDVTGTPEVVNGQNQVVVSPPAGTQFYRLKF
jgi:hypothetical protein